ncbi:MAG: hypothetical protein C7B44_00595 [Sulfobacillus thermosulfidooxidans]|nr:MAG: hypothetical protein C7B44_00595 [Sulfobacillus thermosulfidooxidans]
MFVDKILVRGAAIAALIGGAIFGFYGISAVMYYLIAAGLILLIFSIGWTQRYQRVYEQAPPEYAPTGEVYANPGGSPVEVWHRGIRRIYVQHQKVR